MTSTWRLILDGPVDAATNMARDRAVQLARDEGSAPPTLRLYRWTRPTVTLGRFQDVGDIDRRFCEDSGIDVVRRFTGGRGVLHDDELTYSVVASVSDGVPRGVAASYRYLCRALVESFNQMGVSAEVTSHDRTKTDSGACYLATTRADVSAGLAKLSGSAQVWSGATVLQHGSFVLSRDIEREARVFALSEAQVEALATQATSISELLGSPIEQDRVADAVVRGFSSALGIELELGELSARELMLEASLVQWTDPARPHVRQR